MADSLILMVMALVVFGPRRLPQIGRQIGKLMYEFRKASNDFKFQMEEELRLSEEADRRKKEEERQRSLAALTPPAQASVSADPPHRVLAAADHPIRASGTYPSQYPPEAAAAAQPRRRCPAHHAAFHRRDRRRGAACSRNLGAGASPRTRPHCQRRTGPRAGNENACDPRTAVEPLN